MNAVQKTVLVPYDKYKRCFDERNPQEDRVGTTLENDDAQVGKGLSTDIVMSAIPRPYRQRVNAILLHIEKDPGKVLSWNDRGELRYRGETIPGSHVTDLLKDSQYAYRNLTPLGRKEFYEGLRELNVPQSLIGNERRRGDRPPGIPVHKGTVSKSSVPKKTWITL
jgi:hypothetical protein